MKLLTSKQSVTPYTALASIYDQVMAHVNYRRWAAYIHDIISLFRPQTTMVIDVSCGTGTFCSFLQRYDYQVFGLDNSLPMLKQAVQKEILPKNFICADLSRPPLSIQVDAAVSLYDSMNYLMESTLWLAALRNIYNLLQDGGLYIFDVSTVFNSQKDFSQYVNRETFANGSYLRKSRFDKKKNIQKNYFEIELTQHPKTIFCEMHLQTIRPLDEVVDFINKSPFTMVAGYQDFTFKPYHEKCERVHFVLKKDL